MMDEGLIRRLASILREEELDEIEVRGLFSSIRVSRRLAAPAQAVLPAGPAAPAAGADTREMPAPATADEPAGEPAAVEEGLEEVLSPMVGTFYSSASPGADPFVTVGARVQTGEVICIIEAMKLMNEIEAESPGIVRKILVENAQPVEFGQPLFLVESA